MQSDNTLPELLILGGNGSLESFDPTAPPGKINTKDSLHRGNLYLRATLKEMEHIRRLCESLEENHRELLQGTKARYFRQVDWRGLFRIVTFASPA